MRVLEWIGAICCIAGTLLVGLAISPVAGFILFALSNIAWLVVAYGKRMRGMQFQTWVLLAINLGGVWNYWPAATPG